MGAKIKIYGDIIVINSSIKLKGTNVKALDLRSGGVLMIAGLSAKGETIIDGISQIFRGYEDPLGKLKNVGVNFALARASITKHKFRTH